MKIRLFAKTLRSRMLLRVCSAAKLKREWSREERRLGREDMASKQAEMCYRRANKVVPLQSEHTARTP
jgi:hypothetical protein